MGQPEQQQLTTNAGMSRLKRRRASQDSLLTLRNGAKRALYHCNYCQRDISATVRIKCAVCRDFDLCLGCFAAGAEVTPHKAHHDYRVVEEMSFPLNHPDWGADEELLLLEALDMYGLGNWGAVGDHVNREPAACAAHYEQIYLASPDFPRPTPAPEMDGVDPAEVMRERQRARQASREPQSQPASPMAVDAGGAAAADPQQAAAGGRAAAGAAAAAAADAGAAAVSSGGRPEDTAAGAAGAVKQEKAGAQQSGAEAAAGGGAAAAEAPAAAAAGAAVKQEESATPPQVPVGVGQDTRALPKDEPHGANTPEQAAVVLAKLEGGDADAAAAKPAATGVAPAGGSGTSADGAATAEQQQKGAMTQRTAADNGAQPAAGAAAAGAAAAAPVAQVADSTAAAATEPGTPTDARAAKRRRVEEPDTAAAISAAGASAAVASPGGAGAPGAKTAGSAGAKAKAKEDAKAAGGDGSGNMAAGSSGPKPAHAELGGLRMGGGADGAGGGTSGATSERSAAQGGGGGSGAGHYKAKAKAGVLPDLTGFHAKRLEFEPEYDAEAEALLADLEFRESDTAAEVAAKLTLIAIYNERLTERKRRREFIQAHGLLDIKPQQAAERRWTSLEKEVHARTRAFARYMAPDAHNVLADGLVLEQRLRGRIQELKELRAAGVRTFADAEQYEAEQRRAGGGSGLGAPPRGTASDQQLRQWVPAAATPLPPGAASAAFAPGGVPAPADSRSLAASLAAGRGRRGVQLDITNLPGLEALTSKERELAAGSRLLPPQVLNMAAGLLREAGRRGFVSKAEARPFFRLEGARTLRLLDVLANAGWLQTANPAPSPAVTPGAKGAAGAGTAVPASAIPPAGAPAEAEGQQGVWHAAASAARAPAQREGRS